MNKNQKKQNLKNKKNAQENKARKPKVYRSRESIISALDESLGFLERSIEAYDGGHISEAKRIAVVIRVLLHDTGICRSILKLLNEKHKLQFHNLCNPDVPGNLIPFMGLTGMRIQNPGNGENFIYTYCRHSFKESNYTKMNFDDWWNSKIIDDRKGGRFTRQELTLIISNKDGGAHLDPELDEDFHRLTNENSIGWQAINNRTPEGRPFDNKVELESVVAIGDEVLKTLKDLRPKLS